MKKKRLSQADQAVLTELTRSVTLLFIQVVSIDASCDSIGRIDAGEVSITPQFRASHSSSGKILVCGVKFLVEAGGHESPEGGKESAPSFRTTIEYRLVYETPKHESLPDSVTKAFAGSNAVFNAWPYMRETVHSLYSKMVPSDFIAPLLRIPATRST